jgi:hypothetical protein
MAVVLLVEPTLGKPKKLLEQVRDVMGPFVIRTNITDEWKSSRPDDSKSTESGGRRSLRRQARWLPAQPNDGLTQDEVRLRFLVTLRHFRPIDHVPPSLEIIGPEVLVGEIISVLPDVHA